MLAPIAEVCNNCIFAQESQLPHEARSPVMTKNGRASIVDEAVKTCPDNLDKNLAGGKRTIACAKRIASMVLDQENVSQ